MYTTFISIYNVQIKLLIFKLLYVHMHMTCMYAAQPIYEYLSLDYSQCHGNRRVMITMAYDQLVYICIQYNYMFSHLMRGRDSTPH